MHKHTLAKNKTSRPTKARAKRTRTLSKRKRFNNAKEDNTVAARLKKTLDETAAKLRAFLPSESGSSPRDDRNEMA